MREQVDGDLLQRQVEREPQIRGDARSAAKIFDECGQPTWTVGIDLHVDPVMDHAAGAAKLINAAATVGLMSMMRLKPLMSKTSRTTGSSAQAAKPIPWALADRAATRNTRKPALDTYSRPAQSMMHPLGLAPISCSSSC